MCTEGTEYRSIRLWPTVLLAQLVMPEQGSQCHVSQTDTAPTASNLCKQQTNVRPASSVANFKQSKLANGYGLHGHCICSAHVGRLCCVEMTLGQEHTYMAFGWSRNVKKTTMNRADAVVCNYHSNGTWDVEDYYLESQQRCRTNERGEAFGVCPDSAFGGESNIASTSGFYEVLGTVH